MANATARTRQELVERTLKDLASVELGEAPIITNDPAFKPVRCWTAGPGTAQHKLVVSGTSYGVKPDGTGSYVLRSQAMVDLAKKAFGPRFWPDDIPEDADSMFCDQCGWSTRSYRAFNYHVNQVHPRPQTSG